MTGRARLSQILKVFGWIGLTSLGGGRSVYFHDGLVEKRRWIMNHEFNQDLTLSQLTPGPNMLVAVFVGYCAHGLVGALLACTAMFLPVSIRTAVIARHWETLRERPWALACERALAPIGIGLMAAGVYPLARSGIQDRATRALAILTAVVLYGRWLPPIALVLAAGFVGWLAGL